MISEIVATHLARIDGLGPIGMVVWIGAGTATEAGLAACLASSARRILLVEPDPALARDLTRKTADEKRLTLVACAIAADAGQQPLNIFNMAVLSSLRAPTTGLRELFPGLRLTGTPPVATQTMVGLLDAFDPLPDGQAVLIIDQPGEESVILDQLQSCGRIRDFSHILLRAGAETLYEGATPGPDLARALKQKDWQLQAEDSSDPDFPVYALSINIAAREVSRLSEQLREAENRLADLARQRDAAQAKAEALVVEREAALAKAETLTKERDAARTKTGVSPTSADAGQTRFEKMEERLLQVQNDLSVTLRLHTQARNDLADLQNRYASLHGEKKAQDDLLPRLAISLSAAAEVLGEDAAEASAARTGSKPAAKGQTGSGRARKSVKSNG